MNITVIGKLLVSCAGDCKVKLWLLEPEPQLPQTFTTITTARTLTGHHAVVESLAVMENSECEDYHVIVSGDTKVS
jgi:hypothetical protein